MLKKLALLLVGVLMGVVTANTLHSGDFLDGKMEGCRQIMAVLNQGSPVEMVCVREKKDVVLSIPAANAKFTLDGKRIN
jgi:hypothetical protein